MKKATSSSETSNNIYILSDKKVAFAQNLPMFEIELMYKKIDYSLYDALLFTSKNALHVMSKIDEEWKNKPSYVIAEQTAKVLESLGGKLCFVGKTGHGNSFALEIAQALQGKKVLYLSAMEVVSNLVEILNKKGVLCDVAVVYKTVCKKYEEKIVLPKKSIIIFSSPSTIRCFLENLEWDESFKAVAIGETTAKAFPSYMQAHIAETTSLESCVSKALEINF